MTTPRQTFTRALTGILSFGLLGTGCVVRLGTGEEAHGHDRAEMRVTAQELQGWSADAGWLVSPPLSTPEGASRVGVLLSLDHAGAMPALEARPLSGGAPAGDWMRVTATWSEEDHHVGVAELGRVVDGAQLRIEAAAANQLAQLRWNAVIPEELDAAGEVGDGPGAAREALRAELTGLGIVTREAWGARGTRCSTRDATKRRMAIHYTVTPSQNAERQLRGMQRYHMDTRGWCDIAYHFLVGVDGTIYEGRPLHLLGSHVGGQNTGNIGVAFIGCFNSSGCASGWGPRQPPDAMIQSGARLLGALGDVHGIALDRSQVRGHREHSGQSTSCPGDHLLARVDEMVALAGSAAPTPPGPGPTDPTPTDPAPRTPAPTGASCTHSFGGHYGDTACSAGWQCCDGSWRSRGACGACACVEESGQTGCVAPSAGGGGASGPACSVAGVAGTCEDVSDCDGGRISTPGHCPGPANIQCCTAVAGAGPSASCDPAHRPTPNAGLTEAPGDAGCPAGMARVGSFCIDRYEASLVLVDDSGPIGSWSPFHSPGTARVRAQSIAGAVPQGYIDGNEAAAACREAGKRLCTDTEWLAACRGSANRTYPYGHTRASGRCNDARSQHPAVERFGTSADWIWSRLDDHQRRCVHRPRGRTRGPLREHGRPAGQGSRDQDQRHRRGRHHHRNRAGPGDGPSGPSQRRSRRQPHVA